MLLKEYDVYLGVYRKENCKPLKPFTWIYVSVLRMGFGESTDFAPELLRVHFKMVQLSISIWRWKYDHIPFTHSYRTAIWASMAYKT